MQFLLFLFLGWKVLLKASFLTLHHRILFKFHWRESPAFSNFFKITLICFSTGQIKQASFVHVRDMHTVYFGIQKNYTHTNVKQAAWLVKFGVTERRSRGRLGTSERSFWPRVKNMASRMCQECHTGSCFLEPTALLWEINAMKLPAPTALWMNQISVGYSNNWDVCKPCTTDV